MYVDTINDNFLFSVIARVEEDEDISDVFVRLILAINLHFIGNKLN